MVETNYVGSIVKIVEPPSQKVVNKNIVKTEFRVQLPQLRNPSLVNLVFWGNLARDIMNYYQVNDYIMIEGYLSFSIKPNDELKLVKRNIQKAQITVSKIYPLSLNLKK